MQEYNFVHLKLNMFFFFSHLSADIPFALANRATGFCLVKRTTRCQEVRWTTADRLFVTSTRKCLGAQGKSVGSEVSLYDCDDKSDLQKWECKNETLLALKDTEFFIEIKSDQSTALSKAVGPNNELIITGTSSGACSRTYRGTVWKLNNMHDFYWDLSNSSSKNTYWL